MLTYRLDLSYLGSSFCGWQSQPNGNAIQDHVERILSRVLGESIRLVGASRTDSGVHAEHQVAIFKLLKSIDLRKINKSLNSLLPAEISVRQIQIVDSDFHPIRSCQGKIYRYRLWLSQKPNPFLEPYVWRTFLPLDLEKMQKALIFFQGNHDFTSFCATDSSAKNKVRTIYDIKVENEFPLFNIWFIGNGFLKQMIRTIVGTIVEIGASRMDPNDLEKILDAKDRKMAGPTAPAKGLSLVQLFYEEQPSLSEYLKPDKSQYVIKLDRPETDP